MSAIGTYHSGDTVLHRLSPGWKMLILMIFAVTVVVLPGIWWSLGALAAAAGLAAWARLDRGAALGSLRGLAFVALSLGAYHVWQDGWSRALAAVAALAALVVAAVVFTATTAADDILDTLTHQLGPLRRFGVNPDHVALAVSLTMCAIPTTATLAAETADAARARGLDRSVRARLIPFVLRSVAHARDTGDALAARGLAEGEQ